jgi:hypothetical protein
MNILRCIAFVPAAVVVGLIASGVSDLIIGLALLATGTITWPPPEIPPSWVYFVSGSCYGIISVVVAAFVAPARKGIAAAVVGGLSIAFVLPALFAEKVGVTLYPSQVNSAGVSGVASGVVLGWMVLWVRKRRESNLAH